MLEEQKTCWLQFGLRWLLLLMLCAACYFGGWQSNEMRRKAVAKPSAPLPAGATAYDRATFSFYVGISERELGEGEAEQTTVAALLRFARPMPCEADGEPLQMP